MLILIEGIDGCGKGTQIDLLRKELDCVVFKYPTDKTPELNEFLEKKKEFDQREVFYLFLKDIKNEQEELKKALNSGKTVVLDRYVLSTIAYEKDGIGFDEAKDIVLGMGFVKPDLIILMDMDPKVSQERKRKQKSLDRYEADMKYLGSVRENFMKLKNEMFFSKNWYLIDAKQEINKIHEEIIKIIKR